VHLNLAFAEPLLPDPLDGEPAPGRPDSAPWTLATRPSLSPGPEETGALAGAVRDHPRGLLVVGWGVSLRPAAMDAFVAASGWPVLADPLSGARRGPAAISTYDSLLRVEAFAAEHRPDLVVRIGAGPTSKVLTGWLDDSIPQVVVDPEAGWADPGRVATQRLVADPSALLQAVAASLSGGPRPPGAAAAAVGAWTGRWRAADAVARRALDELLDGMEEPFEGRVARDLVAALPAGATLLVGSSMPVRDVDAFAAPREGLRLLANRGASGIDGLVATALGAAAAGGGPTAALLGDLAFLHDASSLLGAARRSPGVVLVVCDNDGGGIFSFLPQARLPAPYFESLFGTPHGLDLAELATAARIPAQRVTKASALVPALDRALASGRTEVLLVPSDRDANLARHREATAAVAAAYARGMRPP
jgi:2-succinyl-5-enolpyruvyl-6-hydroxy-3-cyclohexene-1-carboxylate synthase